MKVLLVIDGSADSDVALETVVNRPWPEATSCLVVSVVEPLHQNLDKAFAWLGDTALKAQKAFDDDMRKLLNECSDKLKTKFGAQNVTSKFIEGDAKKSILDTARSWQASLLIMSGSAEWSNEQWFTEITRGVIAEAPCSVELLRPVPTLSIEKKKAANEKDILDESRYLIALKNKPNVLEIVDSVASRPWPENSRFQILGVVQKVRQPAHPRFFKAAEITDFAKKQHEEELKQTEKLVKDAAEKLAKFGKDRVTCHVLTGNARSEILQIAQDWPADMIIMGAHDKDHSIAEHYFGSTAAAVVTNASCSVELVKGKLV